MGRPPLLVVAVQLHYPLLQLPCLVGGEAKVAYIVGTVIIMVVVAKLSLHTVGAKQGVCDEGAGKPS